MGGGINGFSGLVPQQVQQVQINATSPEAASQNVGRLGSHAVKVASPSTAEKANLVQTKDQLAASLGGRESAIDSFLQKTKLLGDYINSKLGGSLSLKSELSAAINSRADEWIDTMSTLMEEGVSAEEIDRMSAETVSRLIDLVDKSLGEAPKAPVKEAPKDPVKEAPKAPVNEAPKAPVGEAPKAPVNEAPKAPVNEAPKAPVNEAPKEVIGKNEGRAESPVKDLGQRKILKAVAPKPQPPKAVAPQQAPNKAVAPKAHARKSEATMQRKARVEKLQKGLDGLAKQINIANAKMAAKLVQKTAPKAKTATTSKGWVQFSSQEISDAKLADAALDREFEEFERQITHPDDSPDVQQDVSGWKIVSDQDAEKLREADLKQRTAELNRQKEADMQKANDAMAEIRGQMDEVNKTLHRFSS